jgi:DNA invertase Pin-like site-specific DNA recombinase
MNVDQIIAQAIENYDASVSLRRRWPTIPPWKRAAVLSRRAAGETYRQIREALHVSDRSITRIIAQDRVTEFHGKRAQQILERRKNGEPISLIASALKLSPRSVYKFLSPYELKDENTLPSLDELEGISPFSAENPSQEINFDT